MEGNCVRKGRNGRKLLRRLKPTVGCNGSRRRRKRRRRRRRIFNPPLLHNILPLSPEMCDSSE
jgi:hypothetical protein